MFSAEREPDGANKKRKKRRRVYEDHRPMSELTEGIKHGTLHQVRGDMYLFRMFVVLVFSWMPSYVFKVPAEEYFAICIINQ